MERKVLLHVEHAKKYYPIRGGVLLRTVDQVKAVDDVTLDVYEGEVLGVVGESGSGKSTLGRVMIGLEPLTEGTATYDGAPVASSGRAYVRQRRELQIIFQDPYESLDPRMTVGQIVGEGCGAARKRSREETDRAVEELLEKVGLKREYFRRYPHEFSGGQRQRVGIARALAMSPRLVICDEPVSALDVSVQAQILNLLNGLQREFGLTMVFIAHGLNVVKYICDRIAVMYLGQVLEVAESDALFARPLHPYTQMLLRAIPRIGEQAQEMGEFDCAGDAVNAGVPGEGCKFAPRCPYCAPDCRTGTPRLEEAEPGHRSACLRWRELRAQWEK